MTCIWTYVQSAFVSNILLLKHGPIDFDDCNTLILHIFCEQSSLLLGWCWYFEIRQTLQTILGKSNPSVSNINNLVFLFEVPNQLLFPMLYRLSSKIHCKVCTTVCIVIGLELQMEIQNCFYHWPTGIPLAQNGLKCV